MSNNNRLVFTGNSISTLVNIYTPGSGVGAQSISIRRKLRNKAARFFDEDINNGPTENGPTENGPTENGSTENGSTDIDFSNYNYTSNPNFFNQSGQYLQTQSIVTNMVYGGIGNGIHRVFATSISNDGSVVCFGMDFYRDPIDLIDNIGLVQVYKYDGNTWVQLGTNIEGNIMNDKVGTSTAMNNDGTIIAVSGSGPALNGNTNIYQYSTPGQTGGVWEQLGSTLSGAANMENLGLTCDLDSTGSIIILGTRQGDYVEIYKYSTPGQLGGVWEQLGNTLSNLSGETYAYPKVAINANGNIICIGLPTYQTSTGIVNVYEYSTPGQLGGTWSLLGARINAEKSGDNMGVSVAINDSGTIVACGSYKNDDGGNDSGSVRIFQYSGGSWNKIGQDIDGDTDNSKSGNYVSLSANGLVVAIGAYEHDVGGVDRIGQVRVYRYNIDTDTWVQVGVDLNGITEQQQYGFRLNLNEDGSRLVVGSLSGAERIVVYKYD
jgi:hypothetical protein